MKELLMRLLGVEALRTQLHMMKQELDEVREANKLMQIKLSSMARHEGVVLNHTQAAGIVAVIDDFKARNKKVIAKRW